MRNQAIAAVLCAVSGMAQAAPEWRAVPGAPDISIDIASLQAQRDGVSAWVRIAGSGRELGALRPEPQGRKRANVHRLVVHAQFDCRRRTLRILEAQGYLGSGAPAFMSSVPSAAGPLPADEGLGWTYDAACEYARARADLR